MLLSKRFHQTESENYAFYAFEGSGWLKRELVIERPPIADASMHDKPYILLSSCIIRSAASLTVGVCAASIELHDRKSLELAFSQHLCERSMVREYQTILCTDPNLDP
jgi:hypothetical protein